MATLYVREYARMATDHHGNPVPVGEEPPLAAYTVAIGAGSVKGPQPVDPKTRLIEFSTDAICSVEVDTTASVTASVTRDRKPKDAVWNRGIDASQAGKTGGVSVAVIANT